MTSEVVGGLRAAGTGHRHEYASADLRAGAVAVVTARHTGTSATSVVPVLRVPDRFAAPRDSTRAHPHSHAPSSRRARSRALTSICEEHAKNVTRGRTGTWPSAGATGKTEVGEQFRRGNGHAHLPALRRRPRPACSRNCRDQPKNETINPVWTFPAATKSHKSRDTLVGTLLQRKVTRFLRAGQHLQFSPNLPEPGMP